MPSEMTTQHRLRELWRASREHAAIYRDPVTGDPLTVGEKFSWAMQSIIRRWLFIGLITVATIVVWAFNNATGLTWWNLAASYLALLIESCVGIAMFSQTRRDAVIMRQIKANEERHGETLERLEWMMAHMEKAAEQRTALLEAVSSLKGENHEAR